MTAAAIIHDAGLELFDADSHLVMVEGATPDNAVKLKLHAVECLRTAHRKIEQAMITIEKDLYRAP